MAIALAHRTRSLRLLGLTIIAIAITAIAPAGASAASASVSVFDSLTTLRPDKVTPGGASGAARISAAQNEFESFQILTEAGSGGVSGLNIAPGAALTSPSGAVIPASSMTIYREGYYSVRTRSDAEGDTGMWPDVLIPEVDDLYGEARNAFPVNVGANSQVAAWIDVFVPQGQPAGDYTGSVIVSDSTGTIDTVPVTVTVQGFSIPSTASLDSAFFASAGQICEAFTGDSDCNGDTDKAWQLKTLFAESALNNRTTIANAYVTDPTDPNFAKYFAPLIQGTDSRTILKGAKLTSIETYWMGCVDAGNSCLGAWKNAAQKYDFTSRFFLYACDEPYDAAAWNQCKANAQSADRQWSGVKKLVTSPIAGAKDSGGGASYVDTYTSLVNDIDPPDSPSQRGDYNGFLSDGGDHSLWLYTSCRSFSCDGSEDPAYDGWAGYAIDEPASQSRAMGWTAFAYQATGELLWNTTEMLDSAKTDQYTSGGNGDGTLFYAGTPNGAHGSIAVGGTHDIPLESIRLKRIRDGREDYEYMHLLQQRGQSGAVDNIIEGLMGPNPASHTTVGAGALNQARDQLSAMITGSAVADRLRLKVLRVKIPKSAMALRLHGVRALVRCTVACRVDLGSKVSHRTARRIGVHNTKIAKGSKRLGANRTGWITARLTPHARAKLLHNTSVRRVHVKPKFSPHRT